MLPRELWRVIIGFLDWHSQAQCRGVSRQLCTLVDSMVKWDAKCLKGAHSTTCLRFLLSIKTVYEDEKKKLANLSSIINFDAEMTLMYLRIIQPTIHCSDFTYDYLERLIWCGCIPVDIDENLHLFTWKDVKNCILKGMPIPHVSLWPKRHVRNLLTCTPKTLEIVFHLCTRGYDYLYRELFDGLTQAELDACIRILWNSKQYNALDLLDLSIKYTPTLSNFDINDAWTFGPILRHPESEIGPISDHLYDSFWRIQHHFNYVIHDSNFELLIHHPNFVHTLHQAECAIDSNNIWAYRTEIPDAIFDLKYLNKKALWLEMFKQSTVVTFANFYYHPKFEASVPMITILIDRYLDDSMKHVVDLMKCVFAEPTKEELQILMNTCYRKMHFEKKNMLTLLHCRFNIFSI